MGILVRIQLILLFFLISSYFCADEGIEIQDYEEEHIDLMRKFAPECVLFLKKNEAFPLKEPGRVLLIGAGARGTYKGGTGSGDVNSRYFTTCEKGLENAGFKVVSKDWLDKFPDFKKAKHEEFLRYIQAVADQVDANAGHMGWGAVEPEVDYNLPLDYEADSAIYVLARNSGEGQDRRLVKGDIYLTDSEIRDIKFLNAKYPKFMLVLNVAGVVDLSPIKEVSNILYLSELGVVTGDILADVVLGKVNPSGKLASTWSAVEDYNFIEQFHGIDSTRYLEGVYVGYRYFDSAKVKPLFPFGYGLSYTKFEISKVGLWNDLSYISVLYKVRNTGKVAGKEVVQIYVSPSQKNKDKPYQSLVAFKKTKQLEPGEEQALSVSFKLEDVARFDEKTAQYILDSGNYIIRVGSSSNNTEVFGYINLTDDVITQQLKHIGGKSDFKDYHPKVEYKDNLTKVQEIKLTKNDFTTKKVKYDYYVEYNRKLQSFTDAELAKMCVGNFNDGGNKYTRHVNGAAGETVSTLDKVSKYLVLVDGPAGIRLTKNYTEDGKTYYQYTTAIPIETAMANSFNLEAVEQVGDMVGDEMDRFGVHLWLAPALNIHRNIQNGRNFEYYSEDPLVSGKMAGAITKGVQKHKNRGTTIKHYACNNQENARFHSNSIVSERALREIYLRGYQIAIEDSNPVSLMTSYNLINGLHSSQRSDLIIDVLRSEWGYKGLVMSDWYTTLQVKIGNAHNPNQHAVYNILGGNDLQMGGGKKDYDYIMEAVKNGEINTSHLLECASKVYETIDLLNQ